ncbi:sulfite exporter TauE/SafE family protein [Glacieibacterium frigidum]|uniref:Probable membrane transporter protein n=1 Tax=Glacieibacterium frigidum TaxID=2593303 RepID=A0A552UFG4_9SPHN|nr:sulfite exporter TauE/SafE family protein [Glacieibacterium frigidum]TRW16963.1 sulfite exporter TauE/SafE family protein [Glacieibacterium frigidum]
MAALLFAAGIWAGAQNALAGGGSFITLPALILSGLDPKLANITSTVALFPGQVTTGWAGRSLVAGAERLSFRALAIISLVGGIAGAFLLLRTPSSVFAAMVPWLVLAATCLFAWSSFGPKPKVEPVPPPAWVSALIQGVIAVYSGFFGGGAGIVTLAALTLARMPVRNAGGTKNVLVAISNIAAALVFAFTAAIAWDKALAIGLGSMIGGYAGAQGLRRLPAGVLKAGVVVIGAALTVALFVRG